jgi:LPXTG-motif cell wall-anchored protein
MATSLRRRGVGLTALALASGVTLAATGTAGAAASHAPAYYNGVAAANELGVAVNLPSALSVVSSVLPVKQNLGVNLIGVTGNAVHNTLGVGAKTASTATATLASGSLIDALPAQLGLAKTIKASLSGPQSVSDNAREINVKPLLDVNVGPLTALARGDLNAATAELLNGNVLNLGALLGTAGAGSQVLSTLQNALNSLQVTVGNTTQTVTNAVNSTVSQLTNTLNGVIGNNTVGSTAQAVASQLEAAIQQIESEVNSVVNNLANALQNTSVVSFDTLDAKQSIGAAGNAARSMAQTNLATVNVLNGLVKVQGFQSSATAVANGIAGGASAVASGHQPIVTVGTPVLTASLDQNGLSLSNVTGLPSSVTAQVNSALATLQAAINGLLGTLGVHFNYVQGHSYAAPNGKFATATGPEYDITVKNPLGAGDLAVIGLGHGTTASISAAQAPKTVNVPNSQLHALPHTGANLPLIGGIGLALLIGAGIVRRRVMG